MILAKAISAHRPGSTRAPARRGVIRSAVPTAASPRAAGVACRAAQKPTEEHPKQKEISLDRRTLLACGPLLAAASASLPAMGSVTTFDGPYFTDSSDPDAPTRPDGLAVATFAGGCFWCMEGPFDKIPGVISTTSGYTGGKKESPTYEAVSSGFSGHAEAMEVLYDPTKVTYAQLLDIFWHQINPTTKNQQFCDRGNQYRSAIFPANKGQEEAALKSLQKYQDSGVFGRGTPLVTEIMPLGPFWRAEEYHQDYYMKNPDLYRYYRSRCGRDDYLRKIWGADADAEEPASVIPPASLLLKYGAVLGGAWFGGRVVARALRGAGAKSAGGSDSS